MTCRNEEINKGGAYPRSCPTCKFGPCIRGVIVEGNMQPYANKTERYGILVKEYHVHDCINPSYGPETTEYTVFTEIGTKAQLEEWLKNRNSIEGKIIRYTPVEVKLELSIIE